MTDSDAPLLVVTSRWPAPSETFIVRDLVALRDAGLGFRVLALTGEPGAVVAGIEAEVLSPCQGQAPGSGVGGTVPQWLKQAGRGLRHRETLGQLREFVESRGIRHLHAAHLDLPGWLVAQVARATKRTFSLEGHARDVYCSNFSLAAICRGATHVSVCNEAARQQLRMRVGDGPQPQLIHHCLSVAEPVAREILPTGPVRIAFVGRLVPKKGPFAAIEIASELQAELDRRVRLTMIGEGDCEPGLRDAAAAAGVATDFTGWLAPEAVAAHLREQADLLLVPSRIAEDGDRDGIPNVVLEAMAHSLPVVAAAVGGIPEVVTPATGWTFPEGELECAVAAIQSLLLKPEERQQRALAARQLVGDQFNPETVAATRVRLLQAALANSAPCP